jgi:hypothetical protein
LVSEAGSMRSLEWSSASTWSLVTSMVIHERPEMVGAGTADNRPAVDMAGATGTALVVVAGGTAGGAGGAAKTGKAGAQARAQAEAMAARA